MKKILLIVTVCFVSNFLSAHTIDYGNIILRHWKVEKENKTVNGSFYMYKHGQVYIEDANNNIVHFPLESLSKDDQQFALKKYDWVKKINEQRISSFQQTKETSSLFDFRLLIVLLLLIIFSRYVFYSTKEKTKLKYLTPILAVGVIITLFSFTQKAIKAYRSVTDPLAMDSAFIPFKPNVYTHWDNNYFYVESKGIPTTHNMMVGISNHGWQQQVPISQCYIGANAWSIPLNPVMASNPIPVDSIHFTRGAVAIAVNGVPIFNVHTNTGVDSYLDGQLDEFGGHCGRADDYHYHLPPLSLYNYTSTTMPIAFALDGYAVYGSVEPDGTPMQTLDANHGHLFNGVYHYHGTVAAPYMIANMAGVVTEDSTHQIIPQAAAHPVRPSLTPLNGALITSCLPNANNNGYTLIYTLNGQTDSIVYSWTNNGVYSFNFFTAGNGTSTTQTYNGFSQCDLPNALNEIVNAFKSLQIFPNPNNSTLHIQLPESIQEKDVKSISIYDYEGILIYKNEKLIHEIDIKNFAKGVYLINIQFEKNQMTEKFIVD